MKMTTAGVVEDEPGEGGERDDDHQHPAARHAVPVEVDEDVGASSGWGAVGRRAPPRSPAGSDDSGGPWAPRGMPVMA